MAHRINMTNGRASMAYAGANGLPWHKLGTDVGSLATVEAMLSAAGMDWTVATESVFLADGRELADARAIVRGDTRAVLGVATKQYTPIQNAQAGEIVDALVTGGGAHVDVAGVLDAGERCWMLAKIPGDFEVTRGDLVNPYFLLAWGHDGKHGVAGKLTPIRVVCANTLAAAGLADGRKWSDSADVYLRHKGTPVLRIEEARRALGLAAKATEQTAAAFRALAGRRMTGTETSQYIADVFPLPAATTEEDESRAIIAEMLLHRDKDDAKEAARKRIEETRSIVAELIETGRGHNLPGVEGTAWGAYNAAVEYVDHVYPVTKAGALSMHRQQSAMFGSYATTKRRALDTALALV